MKKTKMALLTASITLLAAGCSAETEEYGFVKAERENIDHVHGAGYPNNEREFFVATHDGLMKYTGDEWLEANSQKHDYMGFQPYKDGFYSSGHPEEGSDLENPLGLVKSTDEGATLNKLQFYGETDFHYLAAGYESGVIFVINEQPNSELDRGFYVTEDEGETWKQAGMNGFDSESIGNIAAHPSDKNIVVIGGKDGVFLSGDQGDNFSKIPETEMVTSVFLKKDTGMFSSVQNGKVQLYELNLADNKVTEFPTPSLEGNNPIMYIAANPENDKGWTVVTYKNNIFTTENNGESWQDISDIGQ